jgi:hypothetical protein
MNASLVTADRRTHLKIIVAACVCCLGFVLVAVHLQAPASAGGQSTFNWPHTVVQAGQIYRVADSSR